MQFLSVQSASYRLSDNEGIPAEKSVLIKGLEKSVSDQNNKRENMNRYLSLKNGRLTI